MKSSAGEIPRRNPIEKPLDSPQRQGRGYLLFVIREEGAFASLCDLRGFAVKGKTRFLRRQPWTETPCETPDLRFLGGVRKLATYLLLLGVVAGLSVRGLGHTLHSHEYDCCEPVAESCCGGDEVPHDSCGEDEIADGGMEDSSHEHQHHHACCTLQPVPAYECGVARLTAPAASLVEMVRGDVLPPEDPVFALDKPPLI